MTEPTVQSIFDVPFPSLQRYIDGEKLSATKLNETVEGTRRPFSSIGSPTQVVPDAIVLPHRQASEVDEVELPFFQEFDDYLELEEPEVEEPEGSVVPPIPQGSPRRRLVAKTWRLRKSSLDGRTVDGEEYIYLSSNRREVVNVATGRKETHTVTPPWNDTQEMIRIKRMVTNMVVPPDPIAPGPPTGRDPPPPVPIEWVVDDETRVWSQEVRA